MINTAILMGRLTADPELRKTPADVSVTRFALAVDRSYVPQGGERQTDFIDVVAWRKTAEFVSRYFRKGMLVAVQGSIQTSSYTDKQGSKRKVFEVVADNVHFAEPKRETAQQPASLPASYNNGPDIDFQEIDDDDLPFC
nr:single-stranded DNA-binding protein [uncultured Solibaculum sp.]